MEGNVFLGNSIDINLSDIRNAEDAMRLKIPDDMKAFYVKQNGGMPERCYFHLDRVSFWLDSLIPIEAKNHEAVEGGMISTFQRMTGENLLPSSSIPFGRDPGGNFFLIDPSDERVWYMPMDEWHHDEGGEANWQRSGRTLCHGFETFMDALSEEDF